MKMLNFHYTVSHLPRVRTLRAGDVLVVRVQQKSESRSSIMLILISSSRAALGVFRHKPWFLRARLQPLLFP